MSQTLPNSTDQATRPPGGQSTAAANPDEDAPDRPKRAPGVKLAGQMRESAYLNPPWLLEREGAGYVQVTELLYRVAEQCNGDQTIEEIAAQISADGMPVSPATIRGLIARMLIPRGLVEAADGSVAESAVATPTPLSLNMKMAMISPGLVSALTAVLRWLYWPPLLATVLIATAAAQGWLYLVHGVAGGVHDALYTPGLLGILLTAVIASAAFHELGHAAALGYAGGTIKSMGVGIYLVYPAFYTDVSDNYRLPRWSRVRTDLGGFYFNAIFALGVMGLYALTGQEFLLVIVLLINFEILHQMLPFVRLDGYWTLVDITGLPDFFSLMAAFVRSILPISQPPTAQRLPPLKWWARLVFSAYILITVPVLVALVLLMIRSVPRVLATAWDSLGQQALVFRQAMASVDVLAILGSTAQVLLLLVPVVGLCLALFSFGRLFFRSVWAWSRPTPLRRVTGVLAMVSAVGLVGFLWAPDVPALGPRPGPLSAQARFEPIRADERGTLGDALSGVMATTGGERSGVTPIATPAEPRVPPAQDVVPTTAPAEPTPAATRGALPVASPPPGTPTANSTAAALRPQTPAALLTTVPTLTPTPRTR